MRAGGGTRRGRLPAVAAVLPLRIVSALWSLTSGATYPSSRWGRGGNKEVGTRFSERPPWLPGRSLSVSIGNFRKYPWRFHLRRRRSPPAMATAGEEEGGRCSPARGPPRQCCSPERRGGREPRREGAGDGGGSNVPSAGLPPRRARPAVRPSAARAGMLRRRRTTRRHGSPAQAAALHAP